MVFLFSRESQSRSEEILAKLYAYQNATLTAHPKVQCIGVPVMCVQLFITSITKRSHLVGLVLIDGCVTLKSSQSTLGKQ
jgi:hypothetical protein